MKIVIDSGSDVPRSMKDNNDVGIEFVALNLQADNRNFVDDEKLNLDEYFDAMEKSSTAVKTAAPSPQAFIEKFKHEGSIFAITISSHLSSTYEVAMLAKKTYLEEVGQKFIHVFDSMSASVAETLIAMKIMEFLKKNTSDVEIVNGVSDFISSMRTIFVLEKYDNLAKSGRMNPYIAKIASMLSIRTICEAKKGIIVPLEKIRGTKKALEKLINIVINEKLDFENRTLGIAHVRCLEKAEKIRDEIKKHVNFKEIFIVDTGGICSTYAERGGIILSY